VDLLIGLAKFTDNNGYYNFDNYSQNADQHQKNLKFKLTFQQIKNPMKKFLHNLMNKIALSNFANLTNVKIDNQGGGGAGKTSLNQNTGTKFPTRITLNSIQNIMF
jgi:hypothetical protein